MLTHEEIDHHCKFVMDALSDVGVRGEEKLQVLTALFMGAITIKARVDEKSEIETRQHVVNVVFDNFPDAWNDAGAAIADQSKLFGSG
jgi:hypothetical protein